MLDPLWLLLATGLYISYIPVTLLRAFGEAQPGRKWTGAGFMGTVVGAACIPLLPRNPAVFAVFLVVAIAASCWICGRAEIILGNHDDSRIVLDEIVGYWTAVAFLPWSPRALLAGFILFRFFDAVKMPPYRRLEELPGGIGVVMDDVGAGVVANLILRAAIYFKPGLFA